VRPRRGITDSHLLQCGVQTRRRLWASHLLQYGRANAATASGPSRVVIYLLRPLSTQRLFPIPGRGPDIGALESQAGEDLCLARHFLAASQRGFVHPAD
jgi:hypothetical protein